MSPLKRIRQFASDHRASVSVEAVLILPILLWAYFGMFILFEGYRALGINNRASYTIADYLSREQNYVTDDYMNGLNDLLDILTQSQQPTVLRVTVVKYDDENDEFELQWSRSTQSGINDITDGTLSEITPHLPLMSSPGVAIVVETWMAFEPFMDIALDSFYFESIVVTRPRFGPQLCFTATLPGNGDCIPS